LFKGENKIFRSKYSLFFMRQDTSTRDLVKSQNKKIKQNKKKPKEGKISLGSFLY